MPLVIDQTVLRNSMLFQGVSDDILNTVSRFCQPMELLAGETLFEQNSLPDAMYSSKMAKSILFVTTLMAMKSSSLPKRPIM